MSGAGEPRPRSLQGALKSTIERLNTENQNRGVPVDTVVEIVADETDYTETDARERLEAMLLDGEVYPPGDGRVRVTP